MNYRQGRSLLLRRWSLKQQNGINLEIVSNCPSEKQWRDMKGLYKAMYLQGLIKHNLPQIFYETEVER